MLKYQKIKNIKNQVSKVQEVKYQENQNPKLKVRGQVVNG